MCVCVCVCVCRQSLHVSFPFFTNNLFVVAPLFHQTCDVSSFSASLSLLVSFFRFLISVYLKQFYCFHFSHCLSLSLHCFVLFPPQFERLPPCQRAIMANLLSSSLPLRSPVTISQGRSEITAALSGHRRYQAIGVNVVG